MDNMIKEMESQTVLDIRVWDVMSHMTYNVMMSVFPLCSDYEQTFKFIKGYNYD